MRSYLIMTTLCLASACHTAKPTPVTAALQQGPASASTASPPASGEVKRELLAHADLVGVPGYESRIYLIEYAPFVQGKLHVHESPAVGYILEGSFTSSFGDGAVETKHAGESFVDEPQRVHHFQNADPTRPLRFIVAGTFKKDEPLVQLVSP